MTGYIINAVMIFIFNWFINKIPCLQNNRGELDIGKLLETKDVTVKIGNTFYTARGFTKPTGKTLSEKLLRSMEKELANEMTFCYNEKKSQKGLDCKHSAGSDNKVAGISERRSA